MQSYENKSKIPNLKSKIEILSHLGFLAAIVLSVCFHELRSTFGESAMILFNLINEPDFFVKSTWFSWNWFQNLMTILAIKSNLSFSLVSLVFSASPTIFLYGIFLISDYIFKQKYSGILLLLLLLGVNQTFFGAVHTQLMAIATIFAILCGARVIWKEDESQFAKMNTWGMLCLITSNVLITTFASPNAYADVIDGNFHFSFLRYSLFVAISTFIIPFMMMTYLILLWIHRKQFGKLAYSMFWIVAMLVMIFFRGADGGLLSMDFERAFFPLIASIVGFFVINLENETKSTSLNSQVRFWIISALVILAVFGQLRSFTDFQKRQNYVVKLLSHAPQFTDKFMLSEHLQQLERYIDPTYLAFETPLIAKFHGLPIQSVFFTPTDTTKTIPEITTHKFNTSFFPFTNSQYFVYNEPFIKKTLVGNEKLLEWFRLIYKREVVTGDEEVFALTTILGLRRGDSVQLSVMRKGSDFGHLVISDNLPINTRLWRVQDSVSEADIEGWQKLSMSYIVEKTDRHKVYVMNRNAENDRIEFKNLSIEIWRE
jgi:hypothetical protein